MNNKKIDNLAKVVVIAGPTASGKTDLGKLIASNYRGVVVSIDSRQVYRGLDLGTGKDKTFEQLMIDIVAPGQTLSVADFAQKAVKEIDCLHRLNILPVLVGGTGYYLDAVLYQKEFPSTQNPKLVAQLEKLSIHELVDRLFKIDSKSARRCGKNRRRLVRALEIVETTGKKVPEILPKSRYKHLLIILDPGVEGVRERIEKRLDNRFKQGMVQEVERIRKSADKNWLQNLGLEYKYISQYLDGKLSFYEMREQLKLAIFSFANRQRTWFRRYPKAAWVSKPSTAVKKIDYFLKH